MFSPRASRSISLKVVVLVLVLVLVLLLVVVLVTHYKSFRICSMKYQDGAISKLKLF